ncbi:MAG: hypothetical protein DRJ26_04875 [Candidatus Methanomethylicota archaeon]|uniref:Zinc ribbon domain-containing protein n=1 Tax=Thermoproteota archaeon TaxID=2056631 RepID=A0A497EYL0_9CREN|nr:MAG: hypothetical protein DRJ26_04875 [Candidatus Verstraetearchaeota archaeon]
MGMKCPHCGAEFDVPEGTTAAVCPYCGTTINMATKEIEAEHYIFPVIYNLDKAYKKLKAIISRQFGVPVDFSDSATLVHRQLHYIPLYVYHVEGKAICKDSEVLEVDYVAVPALKLAPVPIPENYRFPVRGRQYFKPAILEMGKYYSPALSREALEKFAKSKIYYRLLSEARLSCPGAPIEIKCKYEGLVHYPIWELIYTYQNEKFKGVVDAVCGEVFFAEYPMSTLHRTISLGLAVGVVAGGLLVGLAIGFLLKSALTSAVGGLIAGIAGAFPPLTKSTFKKQEYKPTTHGRIIKGEELMSILNKGFRLTRFIPMVEL